MDKKATLIKLLNNLINSFNTNDLDKLNLIIKYANEIDDLYNDNILPDLSHITPKYPYEYVPEKHKKPLEIWCNMNKIK